MDWFLYDRDLRHEKVNDKLALFGFANYPSNETQGIQLMTTEFPS